MILFEVSLPNPRSLRLGDSYSLVVATIASLYGTLLSQNLERVEAKYFRPSSQLVSLLGNLLLVYDVRHKVADVLQYENPDLADTLRIIDNSTFINFISTVMRENLWILNDTRVQQMLVVILPHLQKEQNNIKQ